VADKSREPMKVDLRTLFRAPLGVDRELLEIFLKYNDVLLDRGITTYNIWMKRAHYLYGLGRFDDAVDAIEEALKHDPLSSDAHFLLGVCLQLQAVEQADGDIVGEITLDTRSLLESAAVAFEAALELNPGDQEADGHLTSLRCILYEPGAHAMIEDQRALARQVGDDVEPDATPA
jgi:tetratricopeptide (TPR) repeat protein